MSDTHKVIKMVFICAVLGLVLYAGIRFINHERIQNERIAVLEKGMALMQSGSSNDEATAFSLECYSGEGYNYLAIGNSITRHGLADYWWRDDNGMASSVPEKDYFHIVSSCLAEREGGNKQYYL